MLALSGGLNIQITVSANRVSTQAIARTWTQNEMQVFTALGEPISAVRLSMPNHSKYRCKAWACLPVVVLLGRVSINA